MLKFGLGTKVPKLFVNSSLFCTFQSQLKRWFYSRCQMHVFLQFSQKTLVCISRVFETKYQPLSGPCSHRTPCQVLIFSSYPDYFLLVFWELMLGYVTFLCWYPNFLTVRLYPKLPYVLTSQTSNCDLNVKTLTNKCTMR